MILRIVPMICIMGTIFFLSHQPGDSLVLPDVIGIDKIAHLIVYGILAYSILWAFSPFLDKKSAVKLSLATIFFCILFGISDEYHQSFIPGRYPSLIDVIADGLGALPISLYWLNRASKIKSSL